MLKKSLIKIINDADLKESCLNFTSFYIAGKTAQVAFNYFGFDFNKYNSVEHLVVGVGVGTLAYRKAGGGLRGVLSGLIAGSMFNAGWESFEHNTKIYNESLDDMISDAAVVYVGNISAFLGEKFKDYLNRHKSIEIK